MSSSHSAERQLRASNELCSFTAMLMGTSGDLSRVCVCVVLSPRGRHTLQHPNGYLWDLIPGTSEGLQVHRHLFLLFLLLLLHFLYFLSLNLHSKAKRSDIRVFASPRLQAHRFNVLSSVYLAATNDHSPWRGGCLVPNYHLVKYALIHTLHTGRVCMQLPRATLPFFLLNDFVRRLYKHVIVVNLELH